MTVPNAGAQPAEPLSSRQIRLVLVGLMSGMFMAALHQTIVVTAMRTIADDLGALQHQAWGITPFMIAATISTPLYGKLSDIYGRKPFFLTGILVFLGGALLCAMATSIEQIALFRAIQGLGAGGLFSLAIAIIGDIVPPRRRAKYQGYFLSAWAIASILGPLVGGFFAGQETIAGIAGWRWVFLCIAPLALLAMVVVMRTLNLEHHSMRQRIDWGGVAGLCLALVPLLLVAELGREWGWSSPAALTCYLLGVAGVGVSVFFMIRMRDEALIPLSLLRVRTIAVGSIGSVLVGIGMFVGLSTLPLYLQIVRGSTPTQAGLLMVPMSLGMVIGSIAAGQLISRTGRYRIFPILGTATMSASLLGFIAVGLDTPVTVPILLTTTLGIGLGMCLQPITLAMQNAASAHQIGVATSTSTFTRQTGGALGTAGFMAVLFAAAPGLITRALERRAADPAFAEALAANPEFAEQLQPGRLAGVLEDSSFLIDLDPVLARPFLEGFDEATQIVFVSGGVLMAIAVVVMLLLPEVPLRTQSAYAERSAAAAQRAA